MSLVPFKIDGKKVIPRAVLTEFSYVSVSQSKFKTVFLQPYINLFPSFKKLKSATLFQHVVTLKTNHM